MMTEHTLTTEEIFLIERLRSLQMSGMADAFETQLMDPNADLRNFMERFSDIVNKEWQIRYDKKFKRFMKQAHLRYPDASLDTTIYDPARKLDTTSIERLATCHWIDEGRNLLITGMTSSGKTYLSNALCISAIRQLKTVRYVRANTLMLELEQAHLKSTYLEHVTALSKIDLLAIDDFGLMELDLDKCRDLFEVIDGRDGRKSTIIISQFPIKSWFDLFKEHQGGELVYSHADDVHAGGKDEIPMLSESVSVKDGVMTVTLANCSIDDDAEVSCSILGFAGRKASAEILTAPSCREYNDFDAPERVAVRPFEVKTDENGFTAVLPKCSVVRITLS